MIRTVICLLTIGLFSSVYSQNLKIQIVPGESFIRINNEVIDLEPTGGLYETTLPEGVYNLEVWAPKMEKYEEVISIKAEETTTFTKALSQVNSAFLESLRAEKKYGLRKFLGTTTDIAIAGLNIGLISILAIPAADNKYLNDIEEAANNYENAISVADVNFYEGSYNSLVEKHDKRAKNKLRVELPVVVTVASLSTVYYIMRAKNKPIQPAPFIDKNPFLNGTLDVGLLDLEKKSFLFTFKTEF